LELKSGSAGDGSGFEDNSFFGSQNNIPDDINIVNNAVNCYKEAVQFRASFVTSLFTSLGQICGTAMNFVISVLILMITLIKLRIHHLTGQLCQFYPKLSSYCSCTGIRQVRLEIRPEPDLVGFLKYGRISDLPEPVPKSGATLNSAELNNGCTALF